MRADHRQLAVKASGSKDSRSTGFGYQRCTAGGSPRRRYILVSLDYVMLAPDTALETPLHDEARLCFATPMVGG